ncbi:Transcription factor CBF/NF-Y/archaeal histone domain-containing protein [Plasmodiophora brassicae]|uniref:Transcription factor CBF/NF-Y/archaeal histone domain-containing protein n=1 Tax=Plasmodiophora brassicae TaxID=37360 RepID=A0A0G4J515_PLABS|nr:hypothetical protein PBRA_009073 [Plasmodiophora brassicae]SPQ96964.1 unnamed protein product [Plasmodiophora brassicae]
MDVDGGDVEGRQAPAVPDAPAMPVGDDRAEPEAQDEFDDEDEEADVGAAVPVVVKVSPPPKAKRVKKTHDDTLPGLPLGPVTLPMTRVRKVIKSTPSVNSLAGDAGAVIAKSTEFMIARLAQAGFRRAVTEGRRTIQYKDLADVVRDDERWEFLLDIVPGKTTRARYNCSRFAIDPPRHPAVPDK